MATENCVLSVLVTVHNEDQQLEACLECLGFADELIVLLDKCTDGSKRIATSFATRIIEGDWALEGERRNAGINTCRGPWIFEVDADERVPETLAKELLQVISTTSADWHGIPVDNYVGDRLVRYGWGASFGKNEYPGLFRKGAKTWGPQRVHPTLHFTGSKGLPLQNRINHYVDRNISDMLRRLDSYTTARALDIRENGDGGSFSRNIRRIFSRFYKCFVTRKGYREGQYGFLIALFAALYPILSYLKARLDDG